MDDTSNSFWPQSMLLHTAEATGLHGHGFCALCLWQHGCKHSGPIKITWRANRSRRQSSHQLVWGSGWKLRGTARNSSYILARLHNWLAPVALENTKTVGGGSQWVKDQQIVSASVVTMTFRVKLKFTLQTGGFCSETVQGVRPLTLSVQKQVEGDFFHRFFAFPEASRLSRLQCRE